jgi:hypothetical protein
MNMSSSWDREECQKICDTPKQLWQYMGAHQFKYVFWDKETHASWENKLDIHQAPQQFKVTKIYDGLNFAIFQIKASQTMHGV